MKVHNTTNFKVSEFKCPCCGTNRIQQKLIDALQALRTLLKKEGKDYPIHINSGYRCEKHNKEIGGVSNSQHVLGTAADIHIKEMPPKQIAEFAEQIPEFKNGGIGIYSTFVHLDVRGKKARWFE